MQIVVHELVTEVKQRILVGSKPKMLYAIQPYLYRHLSPAGSLYLQIQDTNGNMIANSETIAISSLPAGNYWHGFFRFLISAALKANTEYYVSLKSTGYTYGAGAYVGWCNAFEFKNAFPASYGGASGFSAPLAMRIWENKFTSKGA
jgi:hypothetical protein